MPIIDDDPITELTELDALKVSGVDTPANGTPWLLLKAAATDDDEADEQEDEMTGSAKSSSAEADAQEEEMTDEASKADAVPVTPKARSGSKRAAKELVEKSPGVPDESVATPHEGGHVRDTGVSGQRYAPMTRGTDAPRPVESEGGESPYVIPAEERVEHPGQHRTLAASKVSFVVSSLVDAMTAIEEQRARSAVKGMGWAAVANPEDAAATDVGSGPWESYDSATLSQVAENLAACGKAIDAIQLREAVEAAAGDAGDVADTMDLGDANHALDYALGIVARLAFHEGAAAAKSGDPFTAFSRPLSPATESALRAARDQLTGFLGENTTTPAGTTGTPASEEDRIMVDLTKEELGDLVAKAAAAAVAADRKAAKKAKKAKAEKNANNNGDVTAAEEHAAMGGSADADDLESIGAGAGSVDAKFVNKELAEIKDLLQKVAKRPRDGGPHLTGAIGTPEGRMGEGMAKSAGEGEIEQLEKALAVAKDPSERDRIGERLTYHRLVQSHSGEFGGR